MVVYLGEVSGGEDLNRTGGVPLCLTDGLCANALCVQLPTKVIVLRKKNDWREWRDRRRGMEGDKRRGMEGDRKGQMKRARKGGREGGKETKNRGELRKEHFFPIFCNLFLVQAIATD